MPTQFRMFLQQLSVSNHDVGKLANFGCTCREAVERAVESRRQESRSHTDELKALQKEQQQAMVGC